MTLKEFLEKYPRPWTFEQSDPDGTGVVYDANNQLLVILRGDPDWDDDEERAADPKTYEPVFDSDDDETRSALISLLLGEEDDA